VPTNHQQLIDHIDSEIRQYGFAPKSIRTAFAGDTPVITFFFISAEAIRKLQNESFYQFLSVADVNHRQMCGYRRIAICFEYGGADPRYAHPDVHRNVQLLYRSTEDQLIFKYI